MWDNLVDEELSVRDYFDANAPHGRRSRDLGETFPQTRADVFDYIERFRRVPLSGDSLDCA